MCLNSSDLIFSTAFVEVEVEEMRESHGPWIHASTYALYKPFCMTSDVTSVTFRIDISTWRYSIWSWTIIYGPFSTIFSPHSIRRQVNVALSSLPRSFWLNCRKSFTLHIPFSLNWLWEFSTCKAAAVLTNFRVSLTRRTFDSIYYLLWSAKILYKMQKPTYLPINIKPCAAENGQELRKIESMRARIILLYQSSSSGKRKAIESKSFFCMYIHYTWWIWLLYCSNYI